jgi:phosphatidylethanolamine-binding protein
MSTKSPSVKYSLDRLKKDGKASLRIVYPDTTVVEPGVRLTRAQTKPEPHVSISKDVAKDVTYIEVSIDLDAPFPSFPILAPICHGIQTDLKVTGEPDADGFVMLKSNVPPVVPYGPPGPPPLSAPHRYIFMVWEQPASASAEGIKKAMGLGESVGRPARMRWNEEEFEKKVGLSGEPLAFNYFVCN